MFVHGGLLPNHAEYGLQRLNSDTQQWMLGRSGPQAPDFLQGADAVVWARDYSMTDERRCDCDKLRKVGAPAPAI